MTVIVFTLSSENTAISSYLDPKSTGSFKVITPDLSLMLIDLGSTMISSFLSVILSADIISVVLNEISSVLVKNDWVNLGDLEGPSGSFKAYPISGSPCTK